LTTALRIASALLLIAMAELWWRGVWQPEGLTLRGTHQAISFVNERGQIIISIVHLDYTPHPWMLQQGMRTSTPLSRVRMHYATEMIEVDGYSLFVARASGGWSGFAQQWSLPWSVGRLGPHWNSEGLPYASGRQFGVPIWLLMMLAATPLLFWAAGWWRDRRHGQVGHCPHCHYDLRGNPDAEACPECGHAIGTMPDPHQSDD
jgi:hypothetical protein